jgi:hypothetical protein
MEQVAMQVVAFGVRVVLLSEQVARQFAAFGISIIMMKSIAFNL